MKLQVFQYCEEQGEMNLFFTDDLSAPFAIVSLNDADWRHEYLDPVLEQVGVQVCRLYLADLGGLEAVEAMIAKFYDY